MRKTTDYKKHLVRCAMIALAVVFLIAAIFLMVEMWESHRDQYEAREPQTEYLMHEGKTYDLRDNLETMLILGVDTYGEDLSDSGYRSSNLADFLMLVVIDHAAEEYSVVHINRDTMANVNRLGVAGQIIGTNYQQIALAYTYGNGREVSCRNTLDAVSDLLLKTKINHYIALTMDAVPTINDLVGGVTLTVLDDFTGIDSAMVAGETVTLNGEQALRYVRARQGMEDSTNVRRMERQRQYVKAFYEQALTCVDASDTFIAESVAALNDRLLSDCSVTKLQTLFERIADYEFIGIREIAGENIVGAEYMEFYPNEAAVKSLVLELFYTEVE